MNSCKVLRHVVIDRNVESAEAFEEDGRTVILIMTVSVGRQSALYSTRLGARLPGSNVRCHFVMTCRPSAVSCAQCLLVSHCLELKQY